MRFDTLRVLLVLPLAVAACTSDTARHPLAPGLEESSSTLAAQGASGLLACPTTVGRSGQAEIGPDGGTLTVGGHSLVVPAGAVHRAMTFTLSAPASSSLEIEISAGNQGHYKFRSPVTVRVDYSRCSDSVLPDGPLTAWWIDVASRSKKGEMPSTDDRAARTLTFTTDHLSGYAIAYRNGRGNGEGEDEGN